jgi:hypothetical protein
MLVPFQDLPSESRLWVYQANRFFTSAEKEIVQAKLTTFCDQWLAHGHPLKASFKIEHSVFIVLAVDESQSGASGCSIDGSVRMLKELQSKLGVDFLDRSQVAFLIEGSICLYKLTELKMLFAERTLTADSPSFNNAVSSKQDFERGWLVPSHKTWLSKYLLSKELAWQP